MNLLPKLLLVTTLLLPNFLFAQKWVDTNYNIVETANIKYGTATDFAGAQRDLLMNIAVPSGDTPPPCGRPLFIAVHGGAFMSGSKDGDLPPRWLKDFAKRGYVAISINYRLGLFQTSASAHCNITNLGLAWDCLNVADTAEWGRALYRGMQDAKGAIRYMVMNAAQYNIDPKNVFIAGESAGAFVALATAFLDDPSEKPFQCAALNAVAAPNAIYENACITSMNLGTSISAFNLTRPDLGSIDGALNPTTTPYTIRGVGSFYGGTFTDLFSKSKTNAQPVLYLYHQPNDLVVPYGKTALFSGLAYCATQWPANCAWIMNRPVVSGGSGINSMIKNLTGIVPFLPRVQFDSTNNFADCATQITNPGTAGHGVDNYQLRTLNMARIFASNMDVTNNCATGITEVEQAPTLAIFPNPAKDKLSLEYSDISGNFQIEISNLMGVSVFSSVVYFKHGKVTFQIPALAASSYLLSIVTKEKGILRKSLVIYR